LDLLTSAVGHRWTAPRDLGDTLEHLAVVAAVKGAERRDEADRLESELFAFERLVADNHQLRDALSDPARSTADRQGLVRDLLHDRATSSTLRLAQQTVAGSHRTVALAIEDYQRIAAQHRERLVAEVRVARDLGADDARRLAAALEQQYGRPVHLNVRVDPEVIGGMSVEIGDDVIDGTVSSRLDEARRRLAG
jgi:F-type H+-transporting ATPase subunit delta